MLLHFPYSERSLEHDTPTYHYVHNYLKEVERVTGNDQSNVPILQEPTNSYWGLYSLASINDGKLRKLLLCGTWIASLHPLCEIAIIPIFKSCKFFW